jgi:hypothetical protein
MRFALVSVAALCVASAAQSGVQSAQYSEPTTRYAHGVLGDAIEHGSLKIVTDAGETKVLRLPETRVFEDTQPRLADVDLDGDNEVIVVESSQTQGARLAVYDENGLVAATHFIGQRNRWLAPIGATDLDGDGYVELAYIDRPHLAKTLRVWRFQNGELQQVAEQSGLTNHRIGEDYISGGIRLCDGTPEMIVMDSNWSKIISATFENGHITTRVIGPYSGHPSSQDALICD